MPATGHGVGGPGRSPWLAAGAVLAAAAVLIGAFGAHALDAAPGSRPRELLETAGRYLMFAGLGLMIVGLARDRLGPRLGRLAGGALAGGALLFAGTLVGLALGGPRWLGAATPIGGLLMIAGFVALGGAAAVRPRGRSPRADDARSTGGGRAP